MFYGDGLKGYIWEVHKYYLVMKSKILFVDYVAPPLLCNLEITRELGGQVKGDMMDCSNSTVAPANLSGVCTGKCLH
jgi:hypothetical protein